MSFFGKIFGGSNERAVDELRPIVEEINNLENGVQKLSDEELKNKTAETGGNTILMSETLSSWGGTRMVGDAYLCSTR